MGLCAPDDRDPPRRGGRGGARRDREHDLFRPLFVEAPVVAGSGARHRRAAGSLDRRARLHRRAVRGLSPRAALRLPGEDFFFFKQKTAYEIFAYVKNMAKDGDHYWVFAHVTPTYGPNGRIIGYHSNRRNPERKQVELFEGIYAKLLAEEKRHSDWREGMASAGRMLQAMVAEHHMDYPEFIFSV